MPPKAPETAWSCPVAVASYALSDHLGGRSRLRHLQLALPARAVPVASSAAAPGRVGCAARFSPASLPGRVALERVGWRGRRVEFIETSSPACPAFFAGRGRVAESARQRFALRQVVEPVETLA